MAYQQFMYEEAFDFHTNQHVHSLKTAKSELDADDTTSDETASQRLPPLGACSSEQPIEQQPQPQHFSDM